MDHSPPGSSVHGMISQARILEWVAIPFSRGIFPTHWSNPGDLHCRRILYHLAVLGSPRTLCLENDSQVSEDPQAEGDWWGHFIQVLVARSRKQKPWVQCDVSEVCWLIGDQGNGCLGWPDSVWTMPSASAAFSGLCGQLVYLLGMECNLGIDIFPSLLSSDF